jgi:hypothetical protein
MKSFFRFCVIKVMVCAPPLIVASPLFAEGSELSRLTFLFELPERERVFCLPLVKELVEAHRAIPDLPAKMQILSAGISEAMTFLIATVVPL